MSALVIFRHALDIFYGINIHFLRLMVFLYVFVRLSGISMPCQIVTCQQKKFISFCSVVGYPATDKFIDLEFHFKEQSGTVIFPVKALIDIFHIQRACHLLSEIETPKRFMPQARYMQV